MEVVVAVASAAVSSVVPKLFTVLENKWRGLEDIEEDVLSLHREVDMISASIKDQISHKGQPSDTEIRSMKEFCDLAHNIEDCLDRFIPCAECAKEELQIHNPSKFREEIASLKQGLVDAQQRRERYVFPQSNVDNSSTADVEDTGRRYEARPAVGIEQAKEEIWALLVGGEASKLRVVSIVGFGGSGKTALAWEVYNCPQVAEQFSCRAWATMASKHKHDIAAKEALLKAIQKGLLGEKAQEPVQQTPQQLEDNISHLLLKDRCLIVIDNINTELWEAIKPIFRNETESRILVTTTVTSVANNCSWPGGYVYSMRSLSAKQSKDYLDKKVFVNGCSPDLERGSTAIVNKCDGHPLALVSVAKALQGHKLTGDLCEEMTQNLCSRMEENKNGHFTKLGQVLMNNYSSLPGNSLKTCLLYSSVFPNYHPVSRKTLTRRWLAEGYIDGDQEDANKKLDELIDRNIFQPIDPINNGKAKTCKPHGIMHQFMLHKSTVSNFIATSFGAINRSNSRHLVIENHANSTACNMKHGTGPAGRDHNSVHNLFSSAHKKVDNLFPGSASKQLRPRSVTVFGNAEEAVPDLTSFELLRVLDLKECDGLNEAHLRYIYELSHLKYLALGTLGSSVRDHLPVEMQKLHCLETLDLRKTKIQTLPEGVISLPHLAHLFGKIKLKKCRKNRKKFLQGKSNLQTLAGVVIDSDSGFPELMVHMKKLTKVKIWCEISSTDSNYTILSEAIHKFAQAGTGTPVGTRSLSLHVDDSCKDLLHHHQSDKPNATSRNDGYLSSLKLRGSLDQFHQFVMSLGGLKELCLTCTNLTGADLLQDLCSLRCLVFLKLVEVHLADLVIMVGDLPSLQRLCLVVHEPRFPTIQQGALPGLTSIQLLCDGLHDLGDIEMELFKDLQEIALDSAVNPKTIKLWEDEAKKHPKRPRVILLDKVVAPAQAVVAPAQAMASVKYVASSTVYNNCYTDAPQRKLQRSCQVTPSREQSPPPRSQSDHQVQVRNGLALLSCFGAPEAGEADGGRDAGLNPLHSSSVEQPNKTVPSIMPNGSKEV